MFKPKLVITIMIRVIHPLNEFLISFDLRGHIFRVNVEFATYVHGYPRKKNRAQGLLSVIFFQNY